MRGRLGSNNFLRAFSIELLVGQPYAAKAGNLENLGMGEKPRQ
jgi:hypothetical protein